MFGMLYMYIYIEKYISKIVKMEITIMNNPKIIYSYS